MAQKENRTKAHAATAQPAAPQPPAVPQATPQQIIDLDARPGALSVIVPRRVLSMEEAGQYAGVSKAVIRKEIERGRLAAFRVGDRRIRIPVEALQTYLREREVVGV
jgi:excisionase family DNA binding protein